MFQYMNSALIYDSYDNYSYIYTQLFKCGGSHTNKLQVLYLQNFCGTFMNKFFKKFCDFIFIRPTQVGSCYQYYGGACGHGP